MVLLISENSSLLLGLVPESVGMMIFGVALIAFAICMRWLLGRFEESAFPEEPVKSLVDSSDNLRDLMESELRVNEE